MINSKFRTGRSETGPIHWKPIHVGNKKDRGKRDNTVLRRLSAMCVSRELAKNAATSLPLLAGRRVEGLHRSHHSHSEAGDGGGYFLDAA